LEGDANGLMTVKSCQGDDVIKNAMPKHITFQSQNRKLVENFQQQASYNQERIMTVDMPLDYKLNKKS
jgi:hypothetical protein